MTIAHIRSHLVEVYKHRIKDVSFIDRSHSLQLQFSDGKMVVILETPRSKLEQFISGNPMARIDEHLAKANLNS